MVLARDRFRRAPLVRTDPSMVKSILSLLDTFGAQGIEPAGDVQVYQRDDRYIIWWPRYDETLKACIADEVSIYRSSHIKWRRYVGMGGARGRWPKRWREGSRPDLKYTYILNKAMLAAYPWSPVAVPSI